MLTVTKASLCWMGRWRPTGITLADVVRWWHHPFGPPARRLGVTYHGRGSYTVTYHGRAGDLHFRVVKRR